MVEFIRTILQVEDTSWFPQLNIGLPDVPARQEGTSNADLTARMRHVRWNDDASWFPKLNIGQPTAFEHRGSTVTAASIPKVRDVCHHYAGPL